jgi:hypothetical protein
MKTTILRACCALTLLISLLATNLSATVVTMPLSIEYSNGTPPAGSLPWLTATFDDEGTPGDVKLKLTATNLTGTEFVTNWTFNLNPALSPANIIFSIPTKTGSFTSPTISKLVNSFSAGPDGSYDIQFSFNTSGAGGGIHRFGVGESAEFVITGSGAAAGLVAGDFAFKSQNGNLGVGGPFYTAAHVQGIGANGEDSGWITLQPGFDPFNTVPEPTTLALVALSLSWLPFRKVS